MQCINSPRLVLFGHLIDGMGKNCSEKWYGRGERADKGWGDSREMGRNRDEEGALSNEKKYLYVVYSFTWSFRIRPKTNNLPVCWYKCRRKKDNEAKRSRLSTNENWAYHSIRSNNINKMPCHRKRKVYRNFGWWSMKPYCNTKWYMIWLPWNISRKAAVVVLSVEFSYIS